MTLLTSLVVAGAIAFCAETPHELCAARTLVVAQASDADLHRLENMALRGFIRAKTARRVIRSSDGSGRADDAWRVGSPQDRSDDCEDRVLWVAETLRSEAPALYAAFRPVLIVEGRREGVVSSHLVGVIETASGALVIDPRYDGVRPWARYAQYEAYAPEGGIDGRWALYRP